MKLYELIIMKPERVVVKTDSSDIGRMAHLLVHGMDPEHGVMPYLHSTRPLKDGEEEEWDEPKPAA